jgi:hypothetical protein
MTTGTITTGVWNNPPHSKFHYCKTWDGQDGKTIVTRFTRKNKWNPYLLSTGRMRSSNPNRLGYYDAISGGAYKVVNNHSFLNLGGDAGTEGYRCPVGGGTFFPLAFPDSKFNTFWGTAQEYTLLSRFLKKVKGHELNLGVSLAECDKLARTVGDTLQNLAFGVADLSKGNFASFARRFGTGAPSKDAQRRLRWKDVPGRFLEMRYAWAPAIQDTFEVAKAFESLSNGPRQTTFHKAYRIGRALHYTTNYVDNVQQQVTVSKSYLFEMYEEMSAARQMGLANPATIIWERLPWSFVVDWFIPIGTYLDLIGQVPFMKGRFLVSKSIRWKSSGTYRMKTTATNTPALPFVDCDWERFNLQRYVTTNPGVPFPDFKVAGAVHGKRVGNAIALASQAFLKAWLG